MENANEYWFCNRYDTMSHYAKTLMKKDVLICLGSLNFKYRMCITFFLWYIVVKTDLNRLIQRYIKRFYILLFENKKMYTICHTKGIHKNQAALRLDVTGVYKLSYNLYTPFILHRFCESNNQCTQRKKGKKMYC